MIRRPRNRKRWFMSDGLWIVILEMLVVLGLVVFIVWWTMGGRRKGDD